MTQRTIETDAMVVVITLVTRIDIGSFVYRSVNIKTHWLSELLLGNGLNMAIALSLMERTRESSVLSFNYCAESLVQHTIAGSDTVI